jgi:hypothetical protein
MYASILASHCKGGWGFHWVSGEPRVTPVPFYFGFHGVVSHFVVDLTGAICFLFCFSLKFLFAVTCVEVICFIMGVDVQVRMLG